MEGPRRNTTDPSLDPKHLNPDGTPKPRKVDKVRQGINLDNRIQDGANVIIPETTIESRPAGERHYWWEDDD